MKLNKRLMWLCRNNHDHLRDCLRELKDFEKDKGYERREINYYKTQGIFAPIWGGTSIGMLNMVWGTTSVWAYFLRLINGEESFPREDESDMHQIIVKHLNPRQYR